MNNRFKRLNKYLRQKGVYHIFYYNFNHFIENKLYSKWWIKERKQIFYENTDEDMIPRYIAYAFEWKKTKQGQEFWDKIYEESYAYDYERT